MTEKNTTTPASTSNQEKPRKGLGKHWPWFLVTLLTFGCGMNIYMVIVAVNDPSFAIEKNYYKKAIDWDKTMAQNSMNAQLKWRLDLKTEPVLVNKKARLQFKVKVFDRNGKLLPDVHVSAEVFHNARSRRRSNVDLVRRSNNVHQGDISFHRRGLWVFHFTVVKGKLQFTQKLRRTL